MAALAGKVAIITGGSKGIGKATALRLARDGAKVAIQYLSDDQGAQEVVNTIGEENALAVKGNAGNVADSDELIRRTVDKFGQVDILIANAGSLPVRDLANTSEQDFDDCMDLNVKGPYFLVKKAVPHLRPGARIILVSTTLCHASTISPPYLLYLTTKGAIEQMVRVLAKDLGPKEITINAVAPGPTDTVLFTRGKPEPVLNAIKNLSPRGRLGTPEEIAEAMAFFSSPASGWVSGQILRVNGGMA
ncbi:short-chain dehydrogenase/reductase-like protein sdr [Penicillium longicatenatum]|uniref:short-chain dehydrogenase/reductase-like protein sdr n=1 Tax=Penicillium longicatenatum TaxID=1561947 RepID=UPI002546F957|nr:short-chain dehydrogenase/reductase-like protein sdr [Penicillium longicatenatum]KAJ5649897.1 short-chain dehydrogenase/reductase-like protein sdr [Penicillium longicatenatum]KAJ5672563.1 short-chain dehydrogenase/reductase-like protein sdr [Penicillium longicatenatum]